MALVTYVPQENGDPIFTVFAGLEFRAGEPVEVPATATIEQLIVEKTLHAASGEMRSKGVEKRTPILDMVKANPYFRVEGHEPPPRKPAGRPRMPRTAEEYKGFAMEWFARMEDHRKLAQRWEAEEELRTGLGVHDDSEIVSYLRPFFDARFHELKKAA